MSLRIGAVALPLFLVAAAQADVTVYSATFYAGSNLNTFNGQTDLASTSTAGSTVAAHIDQYDDPNTAGADVSSIYTEGSFSGDATSGYTMGTSFSGDLGVGASATNDGRLYISAWVTAGETLSFTWSGSWSGTYPTDFGSHYFAGIFIQGPATANAAEQPAGYDHTSGSISYDYTFTTEGLYTIDLYFNHNVGGQISSPFAGASWSGTTSGSLSFGSGSGGGGAVPGLGALAPLAAAGLARRRRR